MAIEEKNELNSIELNFVSKMANVSWRDLIIRDDKIISETLSRKVYSKEDFDSFVSDCGKDAKKLATIFWKD